MADKYCFAAYPTAIHCDTSGGKPQYDLLWGRYIRLTGKEQGAWLEIQRSISTYGAIDLRTDGKKAVLACKIEVPRRKDHIWDVYKFEEDDTGALPYISKH